MEYEATTGTLIETLIEVEKSSQFFYVGLFKKFSDDPATANYWRLRLKEECTHEKELKRFRQSLSDEEINEPVDFSKIQTLKDILNHPLENILKEIKNLDDAYQKANELENSEARKVLDFFVKDFIKDSKERKSFILMIQYHLEAFMYLPPFMNTPEQRKNIICYNN